MKATEQDISFARSVAAVARRGSNHCGEGLYWDCVRAEYAMQAYTYLAAAEYMAETGEWWLPSDADLKEIHDVAWASIDGATT